MTPQQYKAAQTALKTSFPTHFDALLTPAMREGFKQYAAWAEQQPETANEVRKALQSARREFQHSKSLATLLSRSSVAITLAHGPARGVFADPQAMADLLIAIQCCQHYSPMFARSILSLEHYKGEETLQHAKAATLHDHLHEIITEAINLTQGANARGVVAEQSIRRYEAAVHRTIDAAILPPGHSLGKVH